MALYQPSNITPSTFAGIGGGVVDAADNVSISWQVNGNSAMTGFSIAIYQNNASSTLVHTFTEASLSPAFYGTDANGNPVFYVYEPGTTWSAAGLSNGNSYKLKITQNYGSSSSVVQNSESVFITRAKPTLSISPSSGTLTSVAQTFTAAYAQAQGDSVSWVRWVLKDADEAVLDDTGTIYTGVLSYTYSGFFTGNTYTLTCSVETSSGAVKSATNTYAVSYAEPEQTGGITLSCNPDDSVSLSWMVGADIPGTPSAEDYGSILNGVLHLAASRSIEWNEVNGESMAFSSPYCFAWRGKVAAANTVSETVNSGTWTVDQTSTTTNSTTVTQTIGTSNWVRNSAIPDKANTTTTVSVSATTPVDATSSEQAIAALGDYDSYTGLYYGSVTITCDNPIISVSEISTSNIIDWAYTQVGDYSIVVTLYDTHRRTWGESWVWLNITTRTYLGSASKTVSQTGISNPVVISTTGTGGTASVTGTSTMKVYVYAKTSGTYSATVSYDYAPASVQKYYAKWGGTLNISGATLTSASVVTAGGDGGATVSANKNTSGATQQNAYVVVVYNSNNTDNNVSCTVRLTYTTQTPSQYKTVVTGTKAGAISASVTSTTASSATVTVGAGGTYTVTMYSSSNTAKTATIAFTIPTVPDSPDLAVITDGENSLTIKVEDGKIGVYDGNDTELAAVPVPGGAWYALAVVRTNSFDAAFFDDVNSGLVQTQSVPLTVTLPSPVSSVSAYGAQDCDFIYLSKDSAYSFAQAGYTPGWDGNSLFYAAFGADLQAGTTTDNTTLSVALYRQEGTELSPLGTFGGTISHVRDYGIRSGREYSYQMYYVASGVYSAGASSDSFCRRFRQHTLIEAEADAEVPDTYHPVHVWRFRDNLDAGSYTNQNTPVLLQNFTKYPLWQPSSQASRSGTLVALIGRFVNGQYSGESTEDMDALFAISESVNPLFYRDMKGNLYMVRLSGPITQTINNQTGTLEVSVSVPWVEVGDAKDAKIYTEG